MKQYVDSNWNATDGPYAKRGFIPIRLETVREIVSNAITNIAANGGLLASDTTPILQLTNGDTDSALRLAWAASNSDGIAFMTPLPPDFDPNSDLELHVVANMAGATDTPDLDLDTFFNTGDTKVSDAIADITGTTVAEYTGTIAAADIPKSSLWMVNIEVTPGAHTTDILYVYAIWLEYTKL